MVKALINKNKNIILYLMMTMVSYLAWVFSFKNAIEVILINRELTKTQSVEEVGKSAFQIIGKKHDFYSAVIKSYKIANADKAGHLWQSISGIALQHGLSISFEPELQNLQDTSGSKKPISFTHFNLHGEYIQIVKALDSITKTSGIGRPSGFLIESKMKTGENRSGKLQIRLQIAYLD